MSQLILEAVERTKKNIPEALKPAINGHVTIAKQNFAEITGINRNKKYFHREAEHDDYRRSLFQRMASFYFSFAFASRTSGDLIETEIKSWFDLKSQLEAGQITPAGNMWDLEETTNALLSQLRTAFISGNRIETRFVLIQIRRNVDAMLKLCDTAMPEFSVNGR